MTTIYDIAKLAGTSKSTVSRVVSGNGYVSKEKRENVLKAMHNLNYIPNQTARNLSQQKSNTLGFLVSDYFPLIGEFTSVFIQVARRKGYNVNLYYTQDKQGERNALDLMATKVLDGIFLMTRNNSWSVIESYKAFGPLATWHRVTLPGVYSAYVDHYPIYTMILKRLTKHGYQRIGHVFSSLRDANTQARLQALKDFSRDCPRVEVKWQKHFKKQAMAGEIAAQQWLQAKQPPQAVICYSDYVAAEFIATLRDAGKKVPEDCLVIGTDNSQIAKLVGFPTVDLCFREQAQNSFNYLYNQLHNEKLPITRLNPQWVDWGRFSDLKK
ncbi:LacI family DNA-binding transcriptional regulator [Pediococcus inopinatus]|uniref:LacI family DNA-binding transcriptional regulator n=1 Tax=Pediococcus inopinatus TaxID=114090 RepID=A0ABZ0Q278_9LACO|nr:LacI family DNA-binding transcriptional regulator [Pediococcus inopinatus]WPC19268.1 LacI family DNA-binding transcriptional regulator [Pediococcus inopinatus]WPC21056.1 LacI family DNA-binding transcriptional regulator [Pediococcus inopinatus]